MGEAAQTLKFNPWHARAEDLAQWAMLRLVNRTDRCGGYYVKDGKTQIYTAPRDAVKARVGYLSHARLLGHYRAVETAQIVGVHTYGEDKFGKWLNIDIDNHDGKDDGRNERFAVHLARKVAAVGMCALLYESNGRGGFHLWVLFDGAVPAWVLKSLGGWLVSDHAEWGFEKPPEVFPKNDGETQWGNWVRLPGRHHTREVWPRVWNGEQWVREEEAVDFVLSLSGCDPDLIPAEAAAFGIEVETGGGPPKQTREEGVVYAWEDFNAKATVDDTAERLERHGWTRGRRRGDGACEMIRPGKGRNGTQGGNILMRSGVPVFFCFTDAAHPLLAMKGYTPAALAAILEHNGNFKANNTALYEQGFGTRTKAKPKAKPKAGQEGYRPDDGAASEEDGESELVFSEVSGIVPEAVHYLVPGYVPRGMVGMIAGDGGHGKSMITLELAAALSSGRCAMGLEYPHPPRGKTLLISCEDDWQRTILPRLAALGADRSNILRVEGVRMKQNGKSKLLDFHMGHYAQLERALVANPDIKLIVIDPAGAYIGRAGVNENQDAELRSVLGPLSEAANRTGATVLLIKHLNKSAGVSAVQRVGGGGAYVNAVRFSYMVAPDPDEPEKKLMLPLKTNVLKAGLKGLSYRMADVPHAEGMATLLREWPEMKPSDADELAKQLFRPQWEGGVDADANSVSGGKAGRSTPPKTTVADCVAFLRKFLGVASWPENEVEDAIKKAGFSFSAFKQAKAQMRGDDKHDPERLSSSPVGSGGKWWLWIGSQYLRPDSRATPAVRTGQTVHTGHYGETGETPFSLSLEERGGYVGGKEGTTVTEGQSRQSRQSFEGIPPRAHDGETAPDDGPEPL